MTTALSAPGVSFSAIDLIQKEATVGAKAMTMQVITNDDRPEYVTISLSRLLNPGVPLEDERPEPVGESTQPSLYAYPFRMSVGAGQSKTLTLWPLRAVETEMVYRLDVRPMTKLLGTEQKKTSASIVVNPGFSALARSPVAWNAA